MSIRHERILIADAHPTMMASVRVLLRETFPVIHMVSDFPSLEDALTSSKFDLVIADLSIPVSSGENVARVIGRLSPGLPFVVLSVHDDPAAASECLAAGARGFVLKRTAVDDLVPAVEAALRGDVFVSPAASKAVVA